MAVTLCFTGGEFQIEEGLLHAILAHLGTPDRHHVIDLSLEVVIIIHLLPNEENIQGILPILTKLSLLLCAVVSFVE